MNCSLSYSEKSLAYSDKLSHFFPWLIFSGQTLASFDRLWSWSLISVETHWRRALVDSTLPSGNSIPSPSHCCFVINEGISQNYKILDHMYSKEYSCRDMFTYAKAKSSLTQFEQKARKLLCFFIFYIVTNGCWE